MKPVALVSMPTLSGRFPSFQLGLLQRTLERAGIPCQPFSLYMYFGAYVGWRLHEALAEVWPSMIGEWLFAREAFGAFASDDEYFATFERNMRTISRLSGCGVADFARVRDEVVPEFLDFCTNRIDWSRFGLIGFSVLFQQNLASIALAKRLKREHPEIPIIFGGGTFEDDIARELLENVPEIDFIHCGDADATLPELCRRLARGEPLEGLRGVMRRAPGGGIAYEGRAPNFADMRATPVPDYDEWFYARRESGYEAWPGAERPMLPIETARGCWWGEKSHCTFCGLNRAGMEFRAKDVPGVIEMLERLARRYGVFSFNAIDNILAPEYVEQLFGALADAGADFRLHYEIRASLTRAQLRRMRAGGLVSVQPGVESFSTHVLRLMGKGTTGVRNLELVKWCTYYGITNLYNILHGFAGETAEDYRAQLELIQKIPHFQPPYAIALARPDRGSPMFTAPERHGVTKLRPGACYRFLYPADRFDLAHVCYYFEDERRDVPPDETYDDIYAAVERWQERWRAGPQPTLRYRKAWRTIVVEDAREGCERSYELEGFAARLYELIADAHGMVEIARFAESEGATRAEAAAALARFEERGIAVKLDERWLALALPANPWFGEAKRATAAAASRKGLPVLASPGA